MNRRLLAVLTLPLLVAVACHSAPAAQAPVVRAGASATAAAAASVRVRTAAKPNVVFVLTDDLSMNLVAHMPHVRALQRSGTTMKKFYVVDSLCCPSRSAIFTGQYPHDNGVFTNSGADGGYDAYNKHGDEKKSFALALQRNGYRTALMGKYLNGYLPTDPVPPGWDEWDATGSGYTEYDYGLNENGRAVRYGHRPKDYLTDVITRKATSFIRASRTPFFLELATFSPHSPYTAAPRDVGYGDRLRYPRTAAYDTLPTHAPSWLAGRTALPQKRKTTLLEHYRQRVAAVQSVDRAIGSIQATLRAKGVAKNTYIVFSSDNGYHMGEYRLIAGKQTAFDTDIHVPLIVTGPGVKKGHTDGRHLASTIDLAPTFETITGSTVGPTVDGTDISPLWRGWKPAHWQQGVLVEHHGPNTQPDDPDRQSVLSANPPSYEAVRTAGALYVRYVTGEQEYYDTTKDPDELHNLAHRGVPRRLRTLLTGLAGCHGAAACQRAAGR